MNEADHNYCKIWLRVHNNDVEQWPDIPGNNDACLCGSGKMFYQCCKPALRQEEVEYGKNTSEVSAVPGKIEVLEIPADQSSHTG